MSKPRFHTVICSKEGIACELDRTLEGELVRLRVDVYNRLYARALKEGITGLGNLCDYAARLVNPRVEKLIDEVYVAEFGGDSHDD